MAKILLVGKSGQIAQSIQDVATDFGHTVEAFSRTELDITNREDVSAKFASVNPDICINTAAEQVVQVCEESPMQAMAVNFLAVRDLAITSKKSGATFVTFSSDYVFDGEKGSSYEESDLPSPLQVYGVSKLAGEYAALNTYPEKSLVIRTAGLYGGKTGSPNKGNFVLNMTKEGLSKDAMEVSSEQTVSPTYAVDLSKALLSLLSLKPEPGIYHLVNEGECNWYEFTKEIFRLREVSTKLSPIDRGGMSAKDGAVVGKVRRPKFSALRNTRAKALGIVLPKWQESLLSYIQYLNKRV